jgi:phospholipid transport system substrate-binding protein
MRPREPMTRRGDKFNVHAVLLFAMMVFLSSEVWAGPATDDLRGTIDRITEVLNDPSLKIPGKQNGRRVILHKLAKERFDEEEMARRALGAHWRKRTKEEKQEFVRIFSDLLERMYLKKIDGYLARGGSLSGENILCLSETVRGRYAVVQTTVKSGKDSGVRIDYLLKNRQDNWFVCDIAIEGVSIVKNYRAQFSEILTRSSFKELIAKLKSKRDSEVTVEKKVTQPSTE